MTGSEFPPTPTGSSKRLGGAAHVSFPETTRMWWESAAYLALYWGLSLYLRRVIQSCAYVVTSVAWGIGE